MKNKKVILSSILSLVLCLGLIAGGTFALFTSKVETNIAVTAAKIELTAAIDSDTVKTKMWGTDYVDGNDGISPDATVTIDGADITLNNIIPGDGVKFDIEIANDSTIAIQYRIVIENKNGSGLNGLVATIGDISYSGVKAGTEWVKIDKGVQIENIPVTIEFPDAEDNDDYQGATTELVVRVEAVQGVSEPKNTVYPSTQEGLKDVVDSATSGEPIEVELPAGNYTAPTQSMQNKDVTFTGTKDTVVDLSDAPLGHTQAASGANVAFEGVTVKFDDTENYTGLAHTKGVVFKDCTIIGKQTLYADAEFINCTFVNANDYSVWTWGAKNVTFTDCTFQSGGKALLVYCDTDTENHTVNVTLNNCKFVDDGTLNTVKAAVEVGSNPKSNSTVYNITMNDCTVEGFAINDEGINTNTTFYGNKNSMDTDHLNVVIDGADVY